MQKWPDFTCRPSQWSLSCLNPNCRVPWMQIIKAVKQIGGHDGIGMLSFPGRFADQDRDASHKADTVLFFRLSPVIRTWFLHTRCLESRSFLAFH